MQWLPNNMFAVNRSFQISASQFNHCSTVCPHGNGVFVAWYSGSGECRDDQSVHIVFIDGPTKSETIRIGDCTGNPVLWAHGNDAILLWSKFEKHDDIRSLVDRWKYCSLWIQRLVYDNGIELLGDPIQIAESDQHLLGRCCPIHTQNGYLLPLYDELKGECVIFAGSGLQFEEHSRFGYKMIQPTLWEHTVDGETKLCALSRNFGSRAKQSFLCESTNGGVTWSDPVPSNLANINNSLHVVHWNKEDVVLWNDTYGPHRDKMTLGVLNEWIPHPGFQEVRVLPVRIVGPRYGAYPSMCVDAAGNLNFTFTNANRTIDYHVWNSKFFRSQRKDSPTRHRSSRESIDQGSET